MLHDTADAPQPEPPLHDVELMECYVDLVAISDEYDEIAADGEIEKSGEVLRLPDGFELVAECGDLNRSSLEGCWIMYEWDSGWEKGQIVTVSGRSKSKRKCVVQFDGCSSSDEFSLDLECSKYYSSKNEEGTWVKLKKK